METRDNAQKALFNAFEKLSAVERTLVQICAIADEPVTSTALFTLFNKLRFHPDVHFKAGRDVEPFLQNPIKLGLLQDDHQVPDSVKEIIVRSAAKAGLISRGAELLTGMDSPERWVKNEERKAPCVSCGKTATDRLFSSSVGPLCAECVLSELRLQADRENAPFWPEERFSAALAGKENLQSRLTAIWKFSDWQHTQSNYNKDSLTLLVQNMGFVDPSPLAAAVRREALQTVIQLRHAILPILLATDRRASWQLNANVVMALGKIDPERPDVRAILQETASDPVPEARRNLVSVLNTLSSPWAVATLNKMTGDADPETRAMAMQALAAVKAKQERRFPPPYSREENYRSQYGPSLRFGPLVREIQRELPALSLYPYSMSEKVCRRVMRDLRIAVYGDDSRLLLENLDALSARCSQSAYFKDPLLRICDNPFDEEWFNSLSENTRVAILPDFFHHAIVNLRPNTDVLAAVMKNPLFKEATSNQRKPVLYYLGLQLTLSGRAEEALPVISEISSRGFSYGLIGLHHFVSGRIEEAIATFDADIGLLRSFLGKRKINFDGVEAIFYLMALLSSRNDKNLKKAELLLQSSLALKNDAPFRRSAFNSLSGVLKMRMFDMENARETLARETAPVSPLAALVNAIASFWVNGELQPAVAARLQTIHALAAMMGLHWIAMEAAALLIRTDKETPEQREFVKQVANRTALQSFAMTLQKEEPWRKNLRALIEIADPSETPPSSGNAGETRLIWLVKNYAGRLGIHPVEQKMTAKGSWSKGRAVALGRLFDRTTIDFAGEEDLAVCAAIRNDHHYYNNNFYFSMDALLPALVGHPRLFLEDSPTVKVEFVKGEPEILVTRADAMLLIRSAVKFPEGDVMLIQETPTRFKVVKITAEHRRIAGILGNDGLKVPESASADVMKAVSAISSFVLVHSDIGGNSENAEEIPSDPTPRVHLLPSGAGFTAEVFVAPFGERGGPFLKPGAGAANILAEINGKRMQTQRNLDEEKRLADRIEEVSPIFETLSDMDRKAFIDDPEDCLQILLDLRVLQERKGVVVAWPEGEKLKVTRELSAQNLQLRIGSGRDWFEVSGSLHVDEGLTLDMKKLLELLQSSRRRFIPLEDGTFLALTNAFRKRLDDIDIYTEKKGKELRLHPLAALAMQDLADDIPDLIVDDGWKERLDAIRAAQESYPAVPTLLRAELRDYQEEGYRWLARLAAMGIGGCLADDMGLGKTIQALTLLLHRASRGPSLVVAPTSVCWNWSAEADRFAPTLNIIPFTGNNRKELVENLHNNDVLVASYGLLVQEEELLASVDWNVVVLDEAQAIKNVATKRFQAAVKLKSGFRATTTGTPIQNHLDELWALFSFINPGLLGTQEKFNARFALPIEKHNNRDARTRLKKLIQPFILRRLKSQVLDELPPRTEIVLQVEMSPEEAAFYEALRQQAIEKIESDDAPIYMKQLKILAEITKLRQAACHPRLVFPETELPSSKLALFGEVVEELLENRHKALVFSQFVRHLDLIRAYLDEKRISYRYLDGSTPPKDRKREVDAFQAGEGDLFLISLKAGGLGLNLTAADYVIHMDPWWNPSVEDQASDRAHRIGQQQPVTIYRLVAKDTIEEKIVKLHQEKRDLAGSLLDGTDVSGKISAEELIQLIKEG